MTDALLSEAVIAYVGSPGRLDGKSYEERVFEALGDCAVDVLPAIKTILDEVNEADPPLFAFPSVPEIGRAVHDFLQDRHSELSTAATRAVANSFAFQWK